eukprot:1136838-Pelagomonas_calceolata.AAC.4
MEAFTFGWLVGDTLLPDFICSESALKVLLMVIPVADFTTKLCRHLIVYKTSLLLLTIHTLHCCEQKMFYGEGSATLIGAELKQVAVLTRQTKTAVLT